MTLVPAEYTLTVKAEDGSVLLAAPLFEAEPDLRAIVAGRDTANPVTYGEVYDKIAAYFAEKHGATLTRGQAALVSQRIFEESAKKNGAWASAYAASAN